MSFQKLANIAIATVSVLGPIAFSLMAYLYLADRVGSMSAGLVYLSVVGCTLYDNFFILPDEYDVRKK